jgi:hypothetical protein
METKMNMKELLAYNEVSTIASIKTLFYHFNVNSESDIIKFVERLSEYVLNMTNEQANCMELGKGILIKDIRYLFSEFEDLAVDCIHNKFNMQTLSVSEFIRLKWLYCGIMFIEKFYKNLKKRLAFGF